MILQNIKTNLNVEEHTFFSQSRNLEIQKNLFRSAFSSHMKSFSDAIFHQCEGSL